MGSIAGRSGHQFGSQHINAEPRCNHYEMDSGAGPQGQQTHHLNLQNELTPHLVLCLRGVKQISAEPWSGNAGKTLMMDLEASDTIDNINAQVQDKEVFSPNADTVQSAQISRIHAGEMSIKEALLQPRSVLTKQMAQLRVQTEELAGKLAEAFVDEKNMNEHPGS